MSSMTSVCIVVSLFSDLTVAREIYAQVRLAVMRTGTTSKILSVKYVASNDY